MRHSQIRELATSLMKDSYASQLLHCPACGAGRFAAGNGSPARRIPGALVRCEACGAFLRFTVIPSVKGSPEVVLRLLGVDPETQELINQLREFLQQRQLKSKARTG